MKFLRLLYKLWMKFAQALGFVNTRILLVIIFYVVLSPVALLNRLFGKSFLDLKIDKQASSYWEIRPDDKDDHDYRRQF